MEVSRPAREIGGPYKCKVSTNLCKSFSKDERNLIFNSFWKMNWQNKTNFVANNLQKLSYEKEDGERSRLFVTYSLPKNNVSNKVCQTFFINTLSIGCETVRKHD